MLLTLSLRLGEGRSIILASATPTNIVWKRLPIAMSNASSAQARAYVRVVALSNSPLTARAKASLIPRLDSNTGAAHDSICDAKFSEGATTRLPAIPVGRQRRTLQ
jgi:hypothetical protein